MKHFSSEHWAFDKRINLSNVITGLTVAISIVWWAAQLEKELPFLKYSLKPIMRHNSKINDEGGLL